MEYTDCCPHMNRAVTRTSDVKLHYEPEAREYYIAAENPNKVYIIQYCPWCGSKLPSYLGGVMVDYILEAGYEGFDDPNLPDEFKTDDWWKKRGL